MLRLFWHEGHSLNGKDLQSIVTRTNVIKLLNRSFLTRKDFKVS